MTYTTVTRSDTSKTRHLLEKKQKQKYYDHYEKAKTSDKHTKHKIYKYK